MNLLQGENRYLAESAQGNKEMSEHQSHSIEEVRTEGEKRAAMTWTQCLKRAFKLDMETCEVCGGSAKVIACITDPIVITKIFTHVKSKQGNQTKLPGNRAQHLNSLFQKQGVILLSSEVCRMLQ